MRNLEKYLKECMNMCKYANIPFRKITGISLNSRMTAWGKCKKNKKSTWCDLDSVSFRIEINPMLVDENVTPTEEGLVNTILHEILHTCESSFNHGATWQKHCDTIRRHYGIDIKRTNTAEEKTVNEAACQEYYKYICKCNDCGHIVGRNRKSNFVNYPHLYRHICGGSFTRIK